MPGNNNMLVEAINLYILFPIFFLFIYIFANYIFYFCAIFNVKSLLMKKKST